MLRHKGPEFIKRLLGALIQKAEFDHGTDNPGKLGIRKLPYEQVCQVRRVANIGLFLKDGSGMKEGVCNDEAKESVFVSEPDNRMLQRRRS